MDIRFLRLPLATCLALALSVVAAPVGVESAAVLAEATRPNEVRQKISSLVRLYRPADDESWRRTLTDAIFSESVAAGVDPLMAVSIVAAESSFRSRVVSRAGAVGLMQLRPFVAEAVARNRDIEWNGLATLYEPQLNVRLGLLYYKELVTRFHGDPQVALTAYLYGPTRVSGQLRRGTYAGSSYARRVLARYEQLRRT